MNIKSYFEYTPSLDLTVAQIGINKWGWTVIDEENKVKAAKIMKEMRFDVLPIRDSDDRIRKYFSTKVWNNFDELTLNSIDETSVIYYRLSFNDLIRKFSEGKKHYYFLTNYKDILGLVSYVNLNCQIVYNYLFQIIADLELSISHALKRHIIQDELIESFKASSDKHQNEIVSSFEKAIATGRDSTIFEHMYLQTIGITINKFGDNLPDRLKQLKKYAPNFLQNGVYYKIRNIIMHPVRPILNDNESIAKIETLIKEYSEIKELLA
jgi:hypothetical protein